MDASVCMCTQVCVCIFVCVCVQLHGNTHVCICNYVYVSLCVWMCISVHLGASVCVCTRAYVLVPSQITADGGCCKTSGSIINVVRSVSLPLETFAADLANCDVSMLNFRFSSANTSNPNLPGGLYTWPLTSLTFTWGARDGNPWFVRGDFFYETSESSSLSFRPCLRGIRTERLFDFCCQKQQESSPKVFPYRY